MTPLFVVENHHEVLLPWAQERLRQGFPAPEVITLDHHTDVVQAWRDSAREVLPGCWQNLDCVRGAVATLRHDEHFDWAVRAGLISGVRICSVTHATPPSLPQLQVFCDPRWQDENAVFAAPETFRPLADSVLESGYLSACLGSLPSPEQPYILDIDCDYFATMRSLTPKDASYIRELARHALLITISHERDWVRLLRFPCETLTSDDVVSGLRRLFR